MRFWPKRPRAKGRSIFPRFRVDVPTPLPSGPGCIPHSDLHIPMPPGAATPAEQARLSAAEIEVLTLLGETWRKYEALPAIFMPSLAIDDARDVRCALARVRLSVMARLAQRLRPADFQ